MKKLFILILFTFPMLLSAETNPYFEQMRNAIQSLKTFSYKMTLVNTSEEGKQDTSVYKTYFKITPKDTAIGAYFAFIKNDTITKVYSGDAHYEYYPSIYGPKIVCEKNRKFDNDDFVEKTEKVGEYTIITPSVITNSLTYSKSVIKLINDSSFYNKEFTLLPDTNINGINCKYFRGMIAQNIAIDAQTGLPVAIIHQNDNRSTQVYFSNFEKLDKNAEKIFTKKAFPKDYKIMRNPKYIERKRPSLASGTAAPDFDLTSLSGKQYSIDSLKGKPTLLVITEPGCAGCMLSIPTLNKLFADYPNFNIIAIDPVGPKKLTEDFARSKEIVYEVLPATKDLAKKYLIYCYPTFIILDKNAIVQDVFFGFAENQYDRIKEKFEKYK